MHHDKNLSYPWFVRAQSIVLSLIIIRLFVLLGYAGHPFPTLSHYCSVHTDYGGHSGGEAANMDKLQGGARYVVVL